MDPFLKPEEVLNQLALKSDMVAADFGCGSGSFTIPLAKKLEDGLVYALDIQEAPLSALKGRIVSEKIKNIKITRCDLEKPKGSKLGDNVLDLVLIPNLLFQAEDKEAILSEAERILKKKGKLVIIDWLPAAAPGFLTGKISSGKAIEIAENLKFKLEKEIKAGSHHYGLIFSKP